MTASIPPSRLRRSYRENGKGNNQSVGNLSHLPEPIVVLVRRALHGESFVPVEAALQVLRARLHGHVAAILGTVRRLGLERLLGARSCAELHGCVTLIVSRLLAPASTLATPRTLHTGGATSTLGKELGLEAVGAEELCAAMDWLGRRQRRIERALGQAPRAGRHPGALRRRFQLLGRGVIASSGALGTRATARRVSCRSSTACAYSAAVQPSLRLWRRT